MIYWKFVGWVLHRCVALVLFSLLFTKHILLGALGGPLMILLFFCDIPLRFCYIDWKCLLYELYSDTLGNGECFVDGGYSIVHVTSYSNLTPDKHPQQISWAPKIILSISISMKAISMGASLE